MEIILWIVAINWGAPLLTWIYPLVMIFIFRDFKFEGFHGLFAKFRLLGSTRVWWKGPNKNYGEFIITAHTPNGRYFLKSENDREAMAFADELDFMEPWHAKWWRDWGGVGLYGFMCYRDRVDSGDDAWVERTKIHEATHCLQWAVLGLLFPVLYLLHMLWILVTQRIKARWKLYKLMRGVELPIGGPNKAPIVFGDIVFEWLGDDLKRKAVLLHPYSKHPYLDCWAERMARKSAGQQVDIEPTDWAKYSGDLRPWW